MGTWGTALTSSDTFQDIYGDFYDLYNNDIDRNIIIQKLLKENADLLNDADDSNDFYFALSKALWETGELPNDYLIKIKNILDNHEEVKRWIRLDGSKKDAEKRQAKVQEFYEKIKVTNQNPRKPKKVKLIDSFFQKGDLVAIKDREGFYTAGIVLYHQNQTEYGQQLIVVTDYYKKEFPSLEDIINAKCFMRIDFKGNYKPWTMYCNSKRTKNMDIELVKVGNTKINIDYPYQEVGHSFGGWQLISDIVKTELDKQKNMKPISVKKMLKKSTFE